MNHYPDNTVLITGAARRIGATIAIAMAEAGWNVAIHYHNSQRQAEELAGTITLQGRKAFLVKADLHDNDSVAGIFPELVRQGARIDCLINNAASFKKDTLTTFTPYHFQQQMQVNAGAALQLTKDFAQHYTSKEGNVIHLTDGIKGWSMSPAFLSYSLSKMALENSVTLLASELAPGIRINAIALGATLEGVQDKEHTFEKIKQMTLLKRNSSEAEIIQTIHYLLAVKSVTGQVIRLAGGL